MKRLTVLLSSALLLSACAGLPFGVPFMKTEAQAREEVARAAASRRVPPPALAADGTARVAIDGVEIEKVEFRAGVSSATVERLARQRNCSGGLGAGLVSQPGPVEVYRMACDNGSVFLAKCELRQCKPM
ncbi:hypothetical protein ACFDR9_002417 [Janthinobacterium sp. CG_23.3]|uniref:hypothetical protein n=1 Tax=Janthinobacterium sp. CG_23.3 TaxID=3349634 RepID=UPI0038D394EE